MRSKERIIIIVLVAILVSVFSTGNTPKGSSLIGVWHIIRNKEFVDLTHTFAPGIPHWPGFPDEERELLYRYDNNPPGPGTLGTGFYIFATVAVNPAGADGLIFGSAALLGKQLIAIGASALYSFIVSVVILKAIDLVVGLRVAKDDEVQGLDITQHSENGYSL